MPSDSSLKVLYEFMALCSVTHPWTVEERDSLDSVHWEITWEFGFKNTLNITGLEAGSNHFGQWSKGWGGSAELRIKL